MSQNTLNVPSPNEMILAAAGGGKTTTIVKSALAAAPKRSAMLTYTQNNVEEIRKCLYSLNSAIPPGIEVLSWYTFLLREMARPYQLAIYDRRIDGIKWVHGLSPRYITKTDVRRFYFCNETLIYSDKVSQFVCECDRASGGAVLKRLERRFDHIYIDEIQDMAGYDVNLIELMLKSRIKITLVGDHRQTTYRTNHSPKNKSRAGIHIREQFTDWHRRSLGTAKYTTETLRCNQAISDLADALFPGELRTKSLNRAKTGHDGVFAIGPSAVREYVDRYRPKVLRLDKRTDCAGYEAMNFGESNGLTFDRVLIFPHKKAREWLSSGDLKHIADSATKMYVGITRARHSVAFVYDAEIKIPGIQVLTAG
jgi:DNA helicase-2/ATP-dependent DNA helicase PcrA